MTLEQNIKCRISSNFITLFHQSKINLFGDYTSVLTTSLSWIQYFQAHKKNSGVQVITRFKLSIVSKVSYQNAWPRKGKNDFSDRS